MNWHRLFGLILADFFTGSPYEVEVEVDSSRVQQFLDVLLLRKGRGHFRGRLPDGLTDLVPHNLITFKYFKDVLSDWVLKELTAHYVSYRKKISPSLKQLLPEDQFRLYAVCASYPHNLANDVPLAKLQDGVYECRRGTDRIRVVALREVPRADHNALWLLFSGQVEGVAYGAAHYRRRSEELSSYLNDLFQGYQSEGLQMSYTVEDYRRDYAKRHLQKLTPEERLEGLTPEQRLAGMTPEQRLQGVPPEQRLQGVPPEQRLAGLSREEIEELLKRHAGTASRQPKRRRGTGNGGGLAPGSGFHLAAGTVLGTLAPGVRIPPPGTEY